MKRIKVKIKPCYYLAVEKGIKLFEVRYNDRDYKVGDILVLREFADGEYTGRKMTMRITYVLSDVDYVKEGFVVLGIKPAECFFVSNYLDCGSVNNG